MKRVFAMLAMPLCLAAVLPAQGRGAQEGGFRNDPAARARYDRMIEAMREARSLRYKSAYRWWGEGGRKIGECTYTAWLKKPNQFRIETQKEDGTEGGVLVGDGRHLWIHWPNGRPFFSSEDPATHDEPRDNHYLKKPAPPGGHSIGHETGLLGAGMSMTILDPSTFHGYTDSLQPYLDGVQGKGAVWSIDADVECDILLVSFMKGQRTWELWVSKEDHLPRRLKQTVRVSYDIVTEERWSDVQIDADMDDSLFAWQPPENFVQWSLPTPEERLLKPGQPAPDFELTMADGSKKKLSSYRGKVVWLNFWRVG